MANPNPINRSYQRCTRCVMDTSDPEIVFDRSGICSHCHRYDRDFQHSIVSGEKGTQWLAQMSERMRKECHHRPYDCAVGLSGGVDSSYLTCLADRLGLRVLAIHVDGGWNTELSANNIECIVKGLGIDLHTIVVDWEEMRDLQLSFFKASVPNCDIPQDHAFVAAIYREAQKKNIKYLLSGVNAATEFIRVNWSHSFMDLLHIKAIQRRFGSVPLRHYPMLGRFHKQVIDATGRLKTIMPLNYCDYNKIEAVRYMTERFGWRSYKNKHDESVLTKFLQDYYFPVKCGIDKRVIQYSDLIHAGSMTREDALKALEDRLWEKREIEADIDYVSRKLGVGPDEFRAILALPLHRHDEYPVINSQFAWMRKLRRIKSFFKKQKETL
jgi:aminotransferase